MSDTVNKKKRSEIMRAVKGSDTKLEIRVRSALWAKDYRYRKNCGKLFGRPDISFKKHKVVIFVDSCFWHKCPKHTRIPKTHSHFWRLKINRNSQRDKEVNAYYKKKKWKVVRIWEHEIQNNLPKAIKRIISFIEK
jgi:DNA mismatch endonuclease (patch repair protein)